MFMDFDKALSALGQIQSGKLYGSFPTSLPAPLDTSYQELKDTVENTPNAAALATVYQEILNILNDGHDESRMKRTFPGFIAECIQTADDVQMEKSPSIADFIQNQGSDFQIYCAMMLQYAKNGYCKLGDVTPEVEPYVQYFAAMEPVIDDMLETDDFEEIFCACNTLILFLWPQIRDMLSDTSPSNSPSPGASGASQGGGPGAGSPGSGSDKNGTQGQQAGQAPVSAGSQTDGKSSDPSNTAETIAEKVREAVRQILKESGANPAPVNCSGNAVDPTGKNQPVGPDSASQNIAQIIKQISQGKAESEVQGILDKEQMDAIRKCKMPLIHTNVKSSITRHFSGDETSKPAYDAIYQEVAPIVRSLTSEMLALFREFNEEAIQHHRAYGPIVEATEAYRPDNKFFAKKKLPDDYPHMAVCLLIDESGSMYGPKIECARRTAVLIERFASGIGVPCMIAGHRVPGHVCKIQIYTDFESTRPDRDRLALAEIRTSGCNRDGYAINVCGNLLAERPEDVKLMIVISDGAPNDTGYRGEEAQKDISGIVAGLRRKGILVYGAAIDEDKDVIEKIYGKNFLSIQNLNSLPRTLVRLIRQQLIS